MKQILIISFSDLEFDARVSRQVNWLKDKSEITCICFKANPNLNGITWKLIRQIPLSLGRKALLALSLFFRFYTLSYKLQHGYKKQLTNLKKEKFDWIIANDIESLPLAFDLKSSKKTQIFFDAHEYAPRHFEDKLWWKTLFAPWYNHLCKTLIPKVDDMSTVSTGLAEEYNKNFGAHPKLITNATNFHNLTPSQVHNPIRLIHHGIVNKSRKIENMLEVARILGKDYTLDLILMLPEYASQDTKRYFEDLSDSIALMDNVTLLGSMPNKEIVPYINGYDIGLFLLEPVNFNYTCALPNKLFDFIQARLAIAIGPSTEMAHYVNTYELGVVSESFSPKDLAEKIRTISKQKLQEFKENSNNVAYQLSEEANKEMLQSIIFKHD